MGKALQIGERAPDFDLPAHSGEMVNLAQLCRSQVVVVFFYPRDDTFGCTREVCAFRDSYQDFVDAHATVVGISGDATASHVRFAAGHRLPYLLLTDADGAVRRLYHVRKTFGLLPGRATFVIDRHQVLRHTFVAQLAFAGHITTALQAVRQLSP